MIDDTSFIIVEAGALPGIFMKTLEAKRLMESGKCRTVQEAVHETGISRSAFYKYKDSVFALSEHVRGRNLTMAMNLEDNPGLLSSALNVLAQGGVNILTINQTIPINHIANITVTIDTRSSDISEIMDELRGIPGITALKILARD
ncbi:MAG: ACT domain-containing protein [Clostridiales bacterium]|jgi:chorismate mutase|nr:ACT domain-containing protein [Clostridiales bacterium]